MPTEIIAKLLTVDFTEGGTGLFIVNDIAGWYYFSARQSYRMSTDLTLVQVYVYNTWYDCNLVGNAELTEIDLSTLIGLKERLDGVDAKLKDLDDRVTALEKKK